MVELTFSLGMSLVNALLSTILIFVALYISSKYSGAIKKALTFIAVMNFFSALHTLVQAGNEIGVIQLPGLSEVFETISLLSLLAAGYFGFKMHLMEMEK